MLRLPTLCHYDGSRRSSDSATQRAEALAVELRRERPELSVRPEFRPLVPRRLVDAPSLHLDDFSEIALLDRDYDPTFLQDRARLRAVDGDVVASGALADADYERYCEHRLRLGHVTWLRPEGARRALGLAASCWIDRRVRRESVRLLREGALHYVHPHMGSFACWGLAHLLTTASRRPVEVIAPPPGLCRFVNDKLRFADLVRRLFGRWSIPPTVRVDNFATLARVVQSLAADSQSIVVKVPDAAGGHGNLVLRARRLRSASIGRIRKRLRRQLRDLPWETGNRLLVGAWQSDVLCAPSVQLWIPPPDDGPPQVEAVFRQEIEGVSGSFRGSAPAELPADLETELERRSWLLGLVLQRLGYIGRCSFDTILTGARIDIGRLEFVECNGRWGGTSAPMSLINRLARDVGPRPYATRVCTAPGVEQLGFNDLLEHFDDDLFDARTGRGWLVLYGPARIRATSGVDAIAFGDTFEHALERVRHEVPARLAKLASARR